MVDKFKEKIEQLFYHNSKSKLDITKKSTDGFFTIIERIQYDKGLKLYDIAAQTGVSVKTLYNLQKQHNNPGEGHKTTINVINKVLKKFPAYRTEWEVIRNTTPQEKVKEVVKKAVFDLSVYEKIKVLGNFYGEYGAPFLNSLDINQAKVTIFPISMIPTIKDNDDLFAINWNSKTFNGICYFGRYKKINQHSNIYESCYDNWCLIKFKKNKGRKGSLIGSLISKNKNNIIDIKYFHDSFEGSISTSEYQYDLNVKLSDIDYALPLLMSVSEKFIESWFRSLFDV